jgi:intracellular multiplication protein IcmD
MRKLVLMSVIVALTLSFVQAVETVNQMADQLIANLGAGKTMILSLSYIAGLGFLIASFYKFKQHKDNPTQVPVGNPLTMIVIAILLMFLANMIMPIGETFFSNPTSGEDLNRL